VRAEWVRDPAIPEWTLTVGGTARASVEEWIGSGDDGRETSWWKWIVWTGVAPSAEGAEDGLHLAQIQAEAELRARAAATIAALDTGEPPSTAEARCSYLVELATQAWDRAAGDRHEFRRHITERMAQAAQVWTCDVDDRGAE